MFERLRRALGLGNKTTVAETSTSAKARHQVRHPKRSEPGRSTTAAFTPLQTAEFLQGIGINVYISDCFSYAQWDEPNEELMLVFRDSGATWYYPCNLGIAQSFAEAPSKGGWYSDWITANRIKGHQ